MMYVTKWYVLLMLFFEIFYSRTLTVVRKSEKRQSFPQSYYAVLKTSMACCNTTFIRQDQLCRGHVTQYEMKNN